MLRCLPIALALMACKNDRAEPPPAVELAVARDAAASAVAEPAPAGDWWAEEQPCPVGTELRGAAPPQGSAIWCERAGGQRHGSYTSWHPLVDDALPVEHERGRFDGGERDGRWVVRWPGGALRREVGYHRGALDGAVRRYYQSGVLRREEQYRRGIPDGVFAGYTAGGERIDAVTIHDGAGVMREWFPGGAVQHEYEMKGGLANGRWVTYDESGAVVGQWTYADGLKVKHD